MANSALGVAHTSSRRMGHPARALVPQTLFFWSPFVSLPSPHREKTPLNECNDVEPRKGVISPKSRDKDTLNPDVLKSLHEQKVEVLSRQQHHGSGACLEECCVQHPHAGGEGNPMKERLAGRHKSPCPSPDESRLNNS